ncbi:MAG: YhfC family intramembrane metalloprotease [Clostridia bacterium]|nr:YhfC family intramembrane metalloprotease [Clostridia bacterium]
MGLVPTASIVCMGISALAGVAIPVVLFIVLRKKTKADILPFFIGCAVMFLFALVLEALIHQLVLLVSPAGPVIRGNIWLYALYGGLMAGLFEETGRFLAFKTVLKKRLQNDDNALMYGAGHGGFEALAVFGSTMISYLVLSVMINTGNISAVTEGLTGDTLTQMEEMLRTLSSTESPMWLVGILERLIAVALHMALSVFVWFAAKNAGRWYYYPVAILIHAAVDAVAVLLPSSFGLPTVAVEGVFAVCTALVVLLARRVWKQNVLQENEQPPEGDEQYVL